VEATTTSARTDLCERPLRLRSRKGIHNKGTGRAPDRRMVRSREQPGAVGAESVARLASAPLDHIRPARRTDMPAALAQGLRSPGRKGGPSTPVRDRLGWVALG